MKKDSQSKVRIVKNLIMIIISLCLVLAIALTSGAFRFLGKKADMPSGNQPPQFSQEDSSNSEMTPPEKPDGEDEGKAPSGDSNMTPPSGDSNMTPPSGDSDNTPPNMGEMPNGQGDGKMQGENSLIKIALVALESLLLAMILAYLFLSKFNKRTLEETLDNKKRVIGFVVAVVILAAGFTVGSTVLPMQLMKSNAPQIEAPTQNNSENTADTEDKQNDNEESESQDSQTDDQNEENDNN